jgi:hypothetical protein
MIRIKAVDGQEEAHDPRAFEFLHPEVGRKMRIRPATYRTR